MEGPDDVRLPELEIFRKYSLALRQEFATRQELLAALEVTYRQAGGISALGAKPSRKADPDADYARKAGLETQSFQAVGATEFPDEDDSVDSYLKEAMGQAAGRPASRPRPAAPRPTAPASAGAGAVSANGGKIAAELPDDEFWGEGPQKGSKKRRKVRAAKPAAAPKVRSRRPKTIRVGPDGNPELPDSEE